MRDNKFIHRSGIHILLVGDPGTAKTKFLRLATLLVSGSRYVDASNLSSAGLAGGCDRVEDMYTGKGRWALIPGALGLTPASGICSVDELNLYKHDFGDFNSALETGEVPINKIVKGTIPTPCSVLAGANPAGKDANRKKFARGIDVSYFDQIGFDYTLGQRFDAILILEDEANMENDELIALSMLSGVVEKDEELESRDTEVSLDFIRKYLAVAREQDIKMTRTAAAYIAKTHASKRGDSKDVEDLRSHRSVGSIMRFTLAIARFDMAEKATMEHVKYAEKILANTLQERDPGLMDGGMSKEDRSKKEYIESRLLEFLKAKGQAVWDGGGLTEDYPTATDVHHALIEGWEGAHGSKPSLAEVTMRLKRMAKEIPHLDERAGGLYAYTDIDTQTGD